MSWVTKKNAEESLEILSDLASVCGSLGGPVSHLLLMLVRDHRWDDLLDFEINYLTVDVNDAIYARQILALFSKLDCLPLGRNRKALAAELFWKMEEKCRSTNRLWTFGKRFTNRIESVIFLTQMKISNILGHVPVLDDLSFAFGPGATTSVNSRCANPRVKLSARLECSENLHPVLGDLLAEVPMWADIHATWETEESLIVPVVVCPGKVVFVPKTAKIDRSIVVEPILNGFFQKGYGTYIRDRLLRCGVNLRDQSRNQQLARVGSIDNSLSTIDLSSASDSISKGVVRTLLPPEWFEVLDALRTPRVILDGKIHALEKFSSMGNGYTFELESLLFYGLAHSCCAYLHLSTENVSVYGDDIIVPVEAMDLLSEVLTTCGFAINTAKSFSSGPFRESCGADYLRGIDVRPFYQKTPVSGQTLFCMHNFFIRNCEVELAAAVLKHIDPTQSIFGPDGYGDGHLIGSHKLRFPRKERRSGWCGGYFDTYSLKPLSFNDVRPGDYVYPSYSVYTRAGVSSPSDPNVVRGSSGYAKVSIYTLSTSVFKR